MTSAADMVQDAGKRFDKTRQGLVQVDNALDNLIRFVNHPMITSKRTREVIIEAVGFLGASKQGEELALRTYKLTERLQLIMQALHNLKDDVEDLQLEVTDLEERTQRWEGNLRG